MRDANVRHIRPAPPPLASYLRPGSRDSALIARMIGRGLDPGSGVVLDPAVATRQEEMRSAALEAGLERILDPRSVELSTPAGLLRPNLAGLEWADDNPHTPACLAGERGGDVCAAIAEHALDVGATAVLAPTHFLEDGEAWLPVDLDLAHRLRGALDEAGGRDVAIYYPVVASLKSLHQDGASAPILDALAALIGDGTVDAVWLRLHPFGTTTAGPLTIRRYLQVARRFHQLGVPVVGERTGTVGVALMAFGAVGGIESAVTFGDRYDHRALTRPSDGRGFIPPPRVYLQAVGALVDKATAEQVLSRPAIGRRHTCQAECCPRGGSDTLQDPRQHFIATRASEVQQLSPVPSESRPEHYLTSFLRPASDRAVQLAAVDASFERHRLRLDSWRVALADQLEADELRGSTSSLAPTGRRVRRSA